MNRNDEEDEKDAIRYHKDHKDLMDHGERNEVREVLESRLSSMMKLRAQMEQLTDLQKKEESNYLEMMKELMKQSNVDRYVHRLIDLSREMAVMVVRFAPEFVLNNSFYHYFVLYLHCCDMCDSRVTVKRQEIQPSGFTKESRRGTRNVIEGGDRCKRTVTENVFNV